jgi:hypothetical protein
MALLCDHFWEPNNLQLKYFSLGICSQYKLLCGDECIDKHLPCKGICYNPDDIFCDESCKSKYDYWDCNGTCNYVSESWKPCNGACRNTENIVCEEKCEPKDQTWECNGQCQHIRKPCNGVCQNPRQKCGKECVDPVTGYKWECNGKCQYFHEPCNGVCIQPRQKCGYKCIVGYLIEIKWECNGQCQHIRKPCNGVCQHPMQKCGKECADLATEHKWECNGECQYLDNPCNGVCQPPRQKCGKECFVDLAKDKKWECNGECQHIDKPCNGVCQHPRQKCGKECIDVSEDKMWECNGECQSTYDPCNGECPTVGNVSNLQESYFKCPRYDTCFLLSKMCDPTLHAVYNENNCFGEINLSDKLCNSFPGSSNNLSCPDKKELMCKQSRQCLQSNDICNDVIDCFDRSDESSCPESLVKELDFSIFNDCEADNYMHNYDKGFRCGNECISLRHWCNSVDLKTIIENYKLNEADCPLLLYTMNNEKLCQNFTFWSNRTCGVFYKRFEGNYPGQCIENKKIKNGEIKNKYWQSDSLQRKCNDNKTSIHEELWCDGYTQCPDESDEDPADCANCPRTYGFPKDYKHATFSCKHKYTGRPICAVPCDGKDDLCLDDTDEQCSTASFISTLLFGTALVLFSVIAGESSIYCVQKVQYNRREGIQLTFPKENFLIGTLELCSVGHSTFKKTFANFKKIHNTEHYAQDCSILLYSLKLMKEKKAQDIAKLFYSLECKYHSGNIESVHICIQRNMGTNKKVKHLFKLIKQSPTKTHFSRRLIPKGIKQLLKTQEIVNVGIFLLMSTKLFAYYTDMYKDIYIIVEYSKLLPVGNLTINSFGFQVFILVIASVTLPIIGNLITLFHFKKWPYLQSKILYFGIFILSPIVPALAIYVSYKLNFLSKRIKRAYRNNNKLKIENSLESIKTLSKNDNLRHRSSMMLSDLRLNENATEHFIQSLVLIMLVALKFTKTGTVSGFQELLVGNGDFYLLVLGAIWSGFSIISGYVQKKIATKSDSMTFLGIAIQYGYTTLAMICRISAIVIFFAPTIGLFNILGHWKMGNLNFASGKNDLILIYNVTESGTLIHVRDIWKPIYKYEELTIFQLDIYYIVFICIILFHFVLVAVIKLRCSKEFKSKKNYFKKMLHILHQGDSFYIFCTKQLIKCNFLAKFFLSNC